jgi:hypothetical protein
MPPCAVRVDMNDTHHVLEIDGHPSQKLCRIRRGRELFLDSFVASWMSAQTGRSGVPFSSKPDFHFVVIYWLERQPRPPHRHACLLLHPHACHNYTCSKMCQVKVWQYVRQGDLGGFLRIWSHRQPSSLLILLFLSVIVILSCATIAHSYSSKCLWPIMITIILHGDENRFSSKYMFKPCLFQLFSWLF